ncbi:MAG: YIP1 family protein [Candidatus Aminicenantes bacterium]|nr:YIP1 family protein [Candidatus Aminicenantes bacterium]MBM3309966.1 YIP1 family protein [Candidatus Aminicenantes bacterium]
MNLVARAQAIILKPKEEWVKIKGEPTPVMQLFTGYALPLAAVAYAAMFIGEALIGYRVPFIGWVRVPFVRALLHAVIFYALAVASVYAWGMVINALAATFGSKPNLENAMKLAVYSATPVWVGGVFNLLPFLSWLGIILGLYGLYVMYLGFQSPMMDTPPDKVVGYLVVSIVVYVVLFAVIAVLMSAIFTVGVGTITPRF